MRTTPLTRRALLAAASTVLGGCLGVGPPSVDDAPTDGASPAPTATATPVTASTATATPANRLTDVAFHRRETCPTPDDAAVGFDADAVVVTGCIRVANGCTVAVLDEATYDPATDRLRVVVGSDERRGPDEMCTQAIEPRGYEVRVDFTVRAPAEVVVVHDGVWGRRAVTTAHG